MGGGWWVVVVKVVVVVETYFSVQLKPRPRFVDFYLFGTDKSYHDAIYHSMQMPRSIPSRTFSAKVRLILVFNFSNNIEIISSPSHVVRNSWATS